MVVLSPTTIGFFLLKMISTWGVKWGVPPLKETAKNFHPTKKDLAIQELGVRVMPLGHG